MPPGRDAQMGQTTLYCAFWCFECRCNMNFSYPDFSLHVGIGHLYESINSNLSSFLFDSFDISLKVCRKVCRFIVTLNNYINSL